MKLIILLLITLPQVLIAEDAPYVDHNVLDLTDENKEILEDLSQAEDMRGLKKVAREHGIKIVDKKNLEKSRVKPGDKVLLVVIDPAARIFWQFISEIKKEAIEANAIPAAVHTLSTAVGTTGGVAAGAYAAMSPVLLLLASIAAVPSAGLAATTGAVAIGVIGVGVGGAIGAGAGYLVGKVINKVGGMAWTYTSGSIDYLKSQFEAAKE